MRTFFLRPEVPGFCPEKGFVSTVSKVTLSEISIVLDVSILFCNLNCKFGFQPRICNKSPENSLPSNIDSPFL